MSKIKERMSKFPGGKNLHPLVFRGARLDVNCNEEGKVLVRRASQARLRYPFTAAASAIGQPRLRP